MKTNITKYRQFCDNHPEVPLFLKDWWLDAVYGKNKWDCSIYEKNNKVIAVWPYKLINGKILMPKLTQFQGPFMLNFEDMSTNETYEALNSLLLSAPKNSYFSHKLSHLMKHNLPLQWNGFNENTLYTYRIDNNNINKATLSKNFKRIVNKDLSKNYSFDENINIDAIYELCLKTYKRQNLRPSFSKPFLNNLIDTCVKHSSCKIITGYKGLNPVAFSLFTYDATDCYYLLGGADPDERSSGIQIQCIWKGLLFAKENNFNFDFEGSMIPGIENVFRKFGAKPTPYSRVSRINSKSLKIKAALKSML